MNWYRHSQPSAWTRAWHEHGATPLRITDAQPEPASGMSEDVDNCHDRRVTDAVAGIIDARAPIDQTKGMLMLIYGIGEVEAFELLRAEARRTRTSMQALARQFREDVAALDDRQAIPSRAVLDRLLTTAHERITEPRQ